MREEEEVILCSWDDCKKPATTAVYNSTMTECMKVCSLHRAATLINLEKDDTLRSRKKKDVYAVPRRYGLNKQTRPSNEPVDWEQELVKNVEKTDPDNKNDSRKHYIIDTSIQPKLR